MRADLDRAGFITSHTALLPVPHVPELVLHVAEEATELWQKTEDELQAIGLPPPFWAFAWAGGQALARFLLDHPDRVAGARLLDVASGAGLVAIAAARAGAASVLANDVDPFALAAMELNAAANGVTVIPCGGDLIGTDQTYDVVLAADIFYERDTAARVLPWLERLAARGTDVLIGDPGRSYLDRDRLEPIVSYEVPVTRSLEDAAIKRTTVWRLRGALSEARD